MMWENVQIRVVKCQLWDLMVAIELLAADATKVCASNAKLRKWLPMMTTMHAISISTMSMEAIGDHLIIVNASKLILNPTNLTKFI